MAYNYRRYRSAAPTADLLTVDQVKDHLNLSHTADDDLVEIQRDQAIDIVERHIGRALLTQTWITTMDGFPADGSAIWDIRPSPIQSITSLEYYYGGAWVTLDSSEYIAKIAGDQPGEIVMANYDGWPSVDDTPQNVRITYVCGYGDAASDVPGVYKAAVLAVCGELYENRELNVVGSQLNHNRTLDRLLFWNRNRGL